MTGYGDDALPDAVVTLGRDYAAIVDPVAWRLCRDRLPREPDTVLVPDTLERSELQALAGQLPADLDLVGIGGGLVIDATKYLAVERGLAPLLAPSITSNNAPFSDAISVRERGVPIGMVVPGAPRRVVVDYTLIRAAEPRLNRAGYADLLAHETALADWRLGVAAGRLEPDDALCARMAEVLQRARAIAGAVGEVSRSGVEALMRLFEQASALVVDHPQAPLGAGSEHLIAWNLEAVTGRHLIHGEAVATGIVTAAVVQGSDLNGLRAALDAAHVGYGLAELGIGWMEYEPVLLTVADYNRRARGICSVFDRTDWTPDLLGRIRAVIGG